MARVWGCDAWRLDHAHVSGSFEPKGKKGIFVGMSAQRKGWVIFDPSSRTVRTTYHCRFDESLEGRRCPLRDFVLRPRKAGPGASDDDERVARLEGQLYDTSVDLPFKEDFEYRLGDNSLVYPSRQSEPAQAGSSRNSPSASAGPARSVVGARAQEEAYLQSPAAERGVQNGGSAADNGLPQPSPRRVAIGRNQELSEDDTKFLEFAFTHDVPMVLVQKNPKQ
jgi:hypothetical protein